MSDVAQLPVEEPVGNTNTPTITAHAANLAWHRHLGIQPHHGGVDCHAAFLAGWRARAAAEVRPLSEEDM